MMTTKNINLLGLVLLIGGLFFNFTGNQFEISKSEKGEFKLNADGKLLLENKYGHVNIKTWDKQETKIDVLITVKAKNEKTAREIIDNVNVEFTNQPSFVSAKTVFGENSQSFWSWGSNYNASYEVNYTVFMPKNVYLDLSNKYGNAAVPSLDRDIHAEIKYGDINFEDQSKNVNLELGYGNANLRSLANLTADIKYSELDIMNAENVKMDSKYSHHTYGTIQNLNIESGYDDFKIQKVGSLTNNGKYDDFRIEESGELMFDTKYTDIAINSISTSGKFFMSYGDLRIAKVSKGANEIRFEAQYSDMTINEIANCDFDVSGKYSDASFGSNVSFSRKENESTTISYKGKVNGGGTAVNVTVAYGSIKIK